MTLNRTGLILGLSLCTGIVGCEGDEECPYERPVAVIELVSGDLLVNQQVEFSAESSIISCDRRHTFTWNYLAVPEGSANTDLGWQGQGSQSGGTQNVTFDQPGTYVIRLVIFDNVQNSVESIKVVEVAADNLAPEANAGEDQAARVDEKATFDGSASYDPEDELEEYRWQLEEGPFGTRLDTGDIFGADSEVAEFVPDVSGTYVFSLQVKDRYVWSEKDYVSLVTPIDNLPPVAQASDFRNPIATLTPCQSLDDIQLNGSRSYDPEGESLTYEWTVSSVPDGSAATDANFGDALAERPLFSADVPGDYQFDLRVYDGVLWSAWDNAVVQVADIAENVPPTADAGDDVTVEGSAKCRKVNGVFKCPECPTIGFELDAALGTVDPNGDDLSYLWVQTSGPDELTLSYPGGPITTATPAPLLAEYGETITRSYTVQVRAADCAGEDVSEITLTYACEGKE